jgi:protein TonB
VRESALAALNAELREERLRQLAVRGSARAGPPPDRRTPVLGKPELEFEAGIVGGSQRPRSWLLWCSGALHAALLGAALVVPLLREQPLPALASAARAFLVEPAVVAPPPPPPAPPPPAAARGRPRPAETRHAPSFVAPAVLPEQVKPEAVDVGQPQGQPGGVEGGVPGGLVGAKIEKPPEATPPPERRPQRVGINVKEPAKLVHVNPVYPDIAQRANVQGVVILECVISATGRVEDVKVLRGIPLLNDAAIAAVKQWKYMPTLLEGVPVSVVMPVTVQFQLTDARRGRP